MIDWEYGFYDSNPDGHWMDEPQTQSNPHIYWYVFGLPHKTAESARRTGNKSVYGYPVIVRRKEGIDGYEEVPVD